MENPHVYDGLKRLAYQLHEAEHERYSMKALFEIIRWEHDLKTTSRDFKLNNNFTALYARLIMKHEPKLKGFFRTRRRLAA